MANELGKLSVILPVFNGEEFIEANVNHLSGFLHHNVNNYEIIVVNDGSSDRTKDCLKVFHNKKNISVFNLPRNLGKFGALRHGILASTGSCCLVALLVTAGMYDTQCGLKGFNGEIGRELFRLSKDNSFAGDVEILYIAIKHNLDIKRIPVRLKNSNTSTVRFSKHIAKMIYRIARLRAEWYGTQNYQSEKLFSFASQKYW